MCECVYTHVSWFQRGEEEATRPKAYHSGVGRYIPRSLGKRRQRESEAPQPSKKAKARSTLGDFSGW